MTVTALLAQVDPNAIEALRRIAAAQLVMAAIMSVIGLIAVGAAVIVLLELRSAHRLLQGMRIVVDDLKPRLAPLLDRATAVTNDVSHMTGDMRRKLDQLLYTAESLNRAARQAGTATEERMRRFGAVLDIVQTEAEELMLDAAATARGVHEAARVLQEPRPRRARGQQWDDAAAGQPGRAGNNDEEVQP